MPRQLLPLFALTLTACGWLTPPCEKVSRAICQVGNEGDSCSFLLTRGTDGKQAEEVCKDILPAAKEYAENQRDPAAIAEWQKAREQLIPLGFHPDPSRSNIGDKLIRAGGLAGKVVENARANSKAAEDNVNEAAQKVLDEGK